MNNELNKKLAEWEKGNLRFHLLRKLGEFVGFKNIVCEIGVWLPHLYFTDEHGHKEELPNFTESLDACFKGLPDIFHAIEFVYFLDRVEVIIWHQFETYIGEAPKKQEALALCLAVEKLIDEEVKNERD